MTLFMSRKIQKTLHFLRGKFFIFQRFPKEKGEYYTVLVLVLVFYLIFSSFICLQPLYLKPSLSL
jgi:hypothetical protein